MDVKMNKMGFLPLMTLAMNEKHSKENRQLQHWNYYLGTVNLVFLQKDARNTFNSVFLFVEFIYIYDKHTFWVLILILFYYKNTFILVKIM